MALIPVDPGSRTRLPPRRPALTATLDWPSPAGARRFDLTAGFDPATGRVSEVFYGGGLRGGTDLAHVVSDACVVLSVALQHGVPPAALARSLGRVPHGDGVRAASVIGIIATHLAGLGEDDGRGWQPLGEVAQRLVTTVREVRGE